MLLSLFFQSGLQKTMENLRGYNAPDPIECLQRHLKKVTVKNYHGMKPDVDFAKFFVLNVKVLQRMEFEVCNSCNDKWLVNQHRPLQLQNSASRGAEFEFETGYCVFYRSLMYTHGLLNVNPFDLWNQNNQRCNIDKEGAR
jgi:hypothetical protein